MKDKLYQECLDNVPQHIKDEMILEEEVMKLACQIYDEEYADGRIDKVSFEWGFCHAYFLNKSKEK